MSRLDLPPQAYTKEVLASAYQWLRTQPKKIQELAKSPDDMVALYLQARKHRPLPKEKPQAKNFSAELKNLAEGVRQFDDEDATGLNVQRAPEHRNIPDKTQKNFKFHAESRPDLSSTFKNMIDEEIASQDLSEIQQVSEQSPEFSERGSSPTSSSHTNSMNHTHSREQLKSLDERTQEMLKKAARELNLSSPEEALRLLILLGFEKARDLFPKN